MEWVIRREEYRAEDAPDNGNRFLIANGYMGVRGTLDEDGAAELAAVNLAGIYDRVGDGWREPLNAPNPLHTCVSVNEKPLRASDGPLSHRQELDYRSGVMSRKTVWPVEGGTVRVESRRFASMDDVHLLACAYTVTASARVSLRLTADIDTDIWEIYGPHYDRFGFSFEDDAVFCQAHVQSSAKRVAVGRRCTLSLSAARRKAERGFAWELCLSPGEAVTLTSVCAIYTTEDGADPLAMARAALEVAPDYGTLYAAHRARWEAIWRVGAVTVEGDEAAMEALNYSLYHLNSIAPRHRNDLSIPARGLSGQTYKGAIFWDSEMFMLDYFLYTQPAAARSLVKYRIDTLPGAMEKAAHYGWQGAFYAWESQEGGYDACSDHNVTDVFTGRPVRTWFRDKQVHISAAVARAVMLYTDVTGDMTLLAEGGARTVIECARFYTSLLLRYAESGQWEIHDVLGPDEYHERVNNNAYTNRMAAACFDWAARAAALLRETDAAAYEKLDAELGLEELLARFAGYAQALRRPRTREDGVIEQFDGYFDLEDASLEQVRERLLNEREYWGGADGVASHTQVIKQADTVAMLELFHDEYAPEALRRNWEYYEPRTEHGSSLSACMYALVACRFGEPDRAYPFFIRSASADLNGGGKQWAGLVYIGGTHPAAQGGAWKVAAEGFAGLTAGENGLVLKPCLPAGWKRIEFTACFHGCRYLAVAEPDGAKLTALGPDAAPVM